MIEAPICSYEPLTSKDQVREKLHNLAAKPRIGNRAIFEAIADVVSSTQGSTERRAEIFIQTESGSLMLTYDITYKWRKPRTFAEAWGKDSIRAFVDRGSKVTYTRVDQEDGSHLFNRQQRLALVGDLLYGLDRPLL